jgi:FkbM family methyltransferase
MPSIDQIFDAIAESRHAHVPSSKLYQLIKGLVRPEFEKLFSSPAGEAQPFWRFGTLSLPYTKMGAIDSIDLFGLDELIIFAFYHANRSRYQRAIDVGGNLGLHSFVLSRCGLEVKTFEPDPWHFGLLSKNMAANGAATVTPFQAAVSVQEGEAQFVRVLGNTTGSHLAGAKDSYGEKEFFTVKTKAIAPLLEWADLAKIDAEGHEKELLLAATPAIMAKTDIMVEVGSAENAAAIFAHFKAMGVNMFAQKIGWQPATSAADLPISHRDGSLFISAKATMPW